MFEFFGFIIDLLEYIIYYVVTLVNSVVVFLKQIVLGITFVFQTIAFLPPFCRGIIYSIVGVSIITLIVSKFVDVG